MPTLFSSQASEEEVSDCSSVMVLYKIWLLESRKKFQMLPQMNDRYPHIHTTCVCVFELIFPRKLARRHRFSTLLSCMKLFGICLFLIPIRINRVTTVHWDIITTFLDSIYMC